MSSADSAPLFCEEETVSVTSTLLGKPIYKDYKHPYKLDFASDELFKAVSYLFINNLYCCQIYF